MVFCNGLDGGDKFALERGKSNGAIVQQCNKKLVCKHKVTQETCVVKD